MCFNYCLLLLINTYGLLCVNFINLICHQIIFTDTKIYKTILSPYNSKSVVFLAYHIRQELYIRTNFILSLWHWTFDLNNNYRVLLQTY